MRVAWAMSKTGAWTRGCERLKDLVDHKLLVWLLSNRSLADIDNHLLLLLVEKTLGWTFHFEHIAGISNVDCVALSRYPWSEKPFTPCDIDSVVVASMDQEVMVAGLYDMRDETVKYAELQKLARLMLKDASNDKDKQDKIESYFCCHK